MFKKILKLSVKKLWYFVVLILLYENVSSLNFRVLCKYLFTVTSVIQKKNK